MSRPSDVTIRYGVMPYTLVEVEEDGTATTTRVETEECSCGTAARWHLWLCMGCGATR